MRTFSFCKVNRFFFDSVIGVEFHTSKKAKVILTVDGNEVFKLCENDKVRILRSESYVELIDIKGGSFFSSVNRKLMQPLKSFSEDEKI